MPARITRVHEGGAEIAISRDVAERAGLRADEELTVLAPGGSVLLLAREGSRKGFFVGSLATLSVAEVFGFVCSAIRSGTLVLQSGRTRRTVYFRDGQITQATSSERSERLGPVLWREGLVTLEQLEAAEPRVRPGRRLGRILTEQGVLTPADLYRGMQLQVREIVLSVFSMAEGEFSFVEQEPGGATGLKLPERTRDLVLAGIKRADELTRLRARLPASAVPQRGTIERDKLDAHQALLLDQIDGTRTMAEIVGDGRLGEYAALVALEGLVNSGAVTMGPSGAAPRRAPIGAVEATERIEGTEGLSPPELYRAAVAHICEVLAEEGEPPERLNSFFRNPPPRFAELFDSVTLEDGRLDVDRVMANATRLHDGPMGRAMALEALDVFVSFALFDAANILPEEIAQALSRRVTATLLGG